MRNSILFFGFLLILSVSFTSCFKDFWCVTGEGEIVTTELDLENFTGINTLGSFDVIITQGEAQLVEARGHENIIERLKTHVSGKTWDIQLEPEFCYTDYELTIYITVPKIEEISITGSGDVVVNDFSNQESLEINISGSGDVELNDFLGCETLDIHISGSGDIDGKGEFDQLELLDIDISGSGEIDAFKAPTEVCIIGISGSGNCRVNVEKRLDIEISGSGNIYYKGNPYITTNITGSGDIIDSN